MMLHVIKKPMIPLLLWTLLLPNVSAFRSPMHQSLAVVRQEARSSPIHDNTKVALHNIEPSSFFNDFLLLSDAYSDPKGAAVAAASAAAGVPNPTSLFNMNFGEAARNVALGITAIVFLFVGLTSLAASVLIPAGAEQLKIECTLFIPDKWEEYLGKLEEGEEMKDRPDLMFELGLLLNKIKADRLEQVCLEAKLAPELWEKYQNRLMDDQGLQDRPELLAQLGIELSQRAGQVLKENTNVCPTATWEAFEEKAGNDDLIECPGLMEELAQELGYPDLVGACVACLLGDGGETKKIEGDATEILSTISGITEIRRNSDDQWEDDDEDK
jgi:DNA-directed RNA polymerase subunit N (RpoN/RPB10)